MPLSTSVKSITDSPLLSCRRTISSPLIDQAVMSLVKGSAPAQPFSSSRREPDGPVSGFRVSTQVLLRSAVDSSHCPIMSLARSGPVCDEAGEASAIDTRSALTPSKVGRPREGGDPYPLCGLYD